MKGIRAVPTEHHWDLNWQSPFCYHHFTPLSELLLSIATIFIMLTGCLGREFGQGTTGMGCLCSKTVGASAGRWNHLQAFSLTCVAPGLG